MKLTEDTVLWEEDDFIYPLKLIDEPVRKQILENESDAENWRELIAEYTDAKTGELRENVLQQIKDNKEKAEKHDDYVKDDWIAIPRKDFECMRIELKEEQKGNKQLKEDIQKLIEERPELWLKNILQNILATKEGN